MVSVPTSFNAVDFRIIPSVEFIKLRPFLDVANSKSSQLLVYKALPLIPNSLSEKKMRFTMGGIGDGGG